MPDQVLWQSGKLLLTVGGVVLAVGAAGSGSTPVLVYVAVLGAFLLILGAISWALGRVRSTVRENQGNAGLRRIGLVLFAIGVLGLVGGLVGLAITHPASYPRGVSEYGVGSIASVGFYVAIVGAVIVTLSHRQLAHRAQSALTPH